MDFFRKTAAVWEKVSLVQRALLISIALTFIIVGVLVIYWARQPDMRVLYSELSPEDASKIADKISDKDVVYELRGTSIYVPDDKVHQLRLDMAKDGLPGGQQGGYKIFDNQSVAVSPFIQNVNLKRALEEELAKSIQMIDGVDYVRVHIVSAEKTLFSSQDENTTASVILRLRPGYRVSGLNIAAITHLVAGGVEGLDSDGITVIDSQGHLLSSDSDQMMAGGNTVQGYKERVEQKLAEKVEDMLTAVLGPGRVSVKVSAVIDMTSINTIKETPIKGMAKKEEETKKNETGASTTSADGETTIPGTIKEDTTTLTEYELGRTIETTVVYPGEIKSLTVAAFVDLSPPEKTKTENEDTEQPESESTAEPIMAKADVEAIIRNALGLKETEIDNLKVVEVKFNRPAQILAGEKASSWPRYIEIARQGSLGMRAICALLVLRIFNGAKKKAGAGAAESGQPLERDGAVGLLPAGDVPSEGVILRQQIASSLQSNPEQVKQLFSGWLEEKEK